MNKFNIHFIGKAGKAVEVAALRFKIGHLPSAVVATYNAVEFHGSEIFK